MRDGRLLFAAVEKLDVEASGAKRRTHRKKYIRQQISSVVVSAIEKESEIDDQRKIRGGSSVGICPNQSPTSGSSILATRGLNDKCYAAKTLENTQQYADLRE